MKKLTHEFAAAAMRERGFKPLEEYPGSDKPWRSLCMECGAEVLPRYASVAKRALRYLAKNDDGDEDDSHRP